MGATRGWLACAGDRGWPWQPNAHFNKLSTRDVVRRPGLDFLGLAPFRCETPDSEGWKSLDFLGFSRLKRDLSMGYARFSLKEISRPPFAAAPALWERQPTILACEKDELVIGKA
jgi:hypothetical protein